MSGHSGGRLSWKLVIVGIAASFMVPVFLNMISSQLIAEITGDQITPAILSKLLILNGFCLIAAVSSRAFIRTLTDRVLRDVATAKEQSAEALASAKSAQDDVALVVEPQEKSDELLEAEERIRNFSSQELDNEISRLVTPKLHPDHVPEGAEPDYSVFGDHLEISVRERLILLSMYNSNFTLRSASGIARELELKPAQARATLEAMSAKGLVATTINAKGQPRYSLTADGRRVIFESRKTDT